MENHDVVSRDAWLEARKQLLVKEKEFTRLRDQLSQARRDLPWERVDKEYVFEGPSGKETLSDLFAGRQQLIIYHFMFDPSWDEGCVHCSFWADNFNGTTVHLSHRDASFVAISRAPLTKLEAFRQRMGWSFKWVSSFGSDFNYDYHVSFAPDELGRGDAYYNYALRDIGEGELQGISVFYKDQSGSIFHTYSTYERGIDMVNGAYHFLDLTPKGRDEAGHDNPQYWVDYHDKHDS
ncbi:MAG TPA: thioredoxin family protein [Ktedonobacterales bacterium]|nr:thioredoxin family protein [Ktedonobacterales bacterium]